MKSAASLAGIRCSFAKIDGIRQPFDLIEFHEFMELNHQSSMVAHKKAANQAASFHPFRDESVTQPKSQHWDCE
jgi:hypothetical protein